MATLSSQPQPTAIQSPCQDEKYHILVEFAYKHLDFQLAELESVLDMHGIHLVKEDSSKSVRAREALSSEASTESQLGEPADTEQLDICWMSGLPNQQTPSWTRHVVTTEVSSRRPFLILSFPLNSKFLPCQGAADTKASDQEPCLDIATILLSRCTLVRSVLELWGMSTTLESCSEKVKTWVQQSFMGPRLFQRCSTPSQSWKITIHTLGTTYTREEQEAMRSIFQFLQLAGPVQLKNPDHEFVLIREAELDAMGGPLYPRFDEHKQLIPINDQRAPLAWYFARALGGNRQAKGRGIEEYSLKKRAYLGPTSMDAEISFIMTNLAQVKPGSFAFDPFAGTGSILISCALRGAYCFGTDIDIRVLRGRGENENILSNFRQFNLPRPEIVRSDNAIYHRHYRCEMPLYDVIICDPPYGIRAGARKSGARTGHGGRPIHDRDTHIPQTRPYAVSDVMADLMDVAARTLVVGGRLVYVIPSFYDFDEESDLPRHPCLTLVHVCYQPFTPQLGRRVVAMKKTVMYDPIKRGEYLKCVWKNGPESADKVANLREKLLEAAKLKPGYEERLASRKRKRKEHKENMKKAKHK